MTFQVKTDALKEEVISTVSDLVTKLKLEDRNFAEEFVSKVDHNQLNVTTKVNCVVYIHFLRFFLYVVFSK